MRSIHDQSILRIGFSLVELLMAMSLIGVLAGLVIVAINPTKQMADARNTQRTFDTNSILNAFGQYSVDSGGYFQPRKIDNVSLITECKVTNTPKKLCKSSTPHTGTIGGCKQAECVYSAHLKGAYLADVPDDPLDEEDTAIDLLTLDYLVSSNSPGRFRVDAPNAENEREIGAIR